MSDSIIDVESILRCWWNQGKRPTFLSKTGLNPVLPRDFFKRSKKKVGMTHEWHIIKSATVLVDDCLRLYQADVSAKVDVETLLLKCWKLDEYDTDDVDELVVNSSTVASCCPLTIFNLGKMRVFPRRWRRELELENADVKLISTCCCCCCWLALVGLRRNMSGGGPAGERAKWRDRWTRPDGVSTISVESAGLWGFNGNANCDGRLVFSILIGSVDPSGNRCIRNGGSIKFVFIPRRSSSFLFLALKKSPVTYNQWCIGPTGRKKKNPRWIDGPLFMSTRPVKKKVDLGFSSGVQVSPGLERWTIWMLCCAASVSILVDSSF